MQEEERNDKRNISTKTESNDGCENGTEIKNFPNALSPSEIPPQNKKYSGKLRNEIAKIATVSDAVEDELNQSLQEKQKRYKDMNSSSLSRNRMEIDTNRLNELTQENKMVSQSKWNDKDENSGLFQAEKMPSHLEIDQRRESHNENFVPSANIANDDLSNNYQDEYDPMKRTLPFWRTYDDIIFLSLASQLGILFRILSSSLMNVSSVFSTDSALFTNLPLNCLSCLIMGLLCSGEDAWKAVSARGEELREVQLESMEHRMKRSQSLLLFPGKREESDLMQCYMQQDKDEHRPLNTETSEPPQSNLYTANSSKTSNIQSQSTQLQSMDNTSASIIQNCESDMVNQLQTNNQQETLQQNQRNEQILYSIAHGWDINTSPQAMSADLLLGLRVGFCGALSSFSSWNSSMVNLIRTGNIGDAIMGYIIGFALPIISYKVGIQIAVYFFVAKCRREKRREAKRGGYAIRVPHNHDEEDVDEDYSNDEEMGSNENESSKNEELSENEEESQQQPAETPSLRAIATAIFAMVLVTLTSSLLIFNTPNQQQFAISLLFSPLGVLCRWKLSKYNTYIKSFPLGTFAANILGCSLSGSIGSLLAGNPGEEERIFLTSMISGLAGSLSTLSTFVVQVLDLVDVVLYRLDGAIYAFVTIFWGIVIGLLTRSAVDWADGF